MEKKKEIAKKPAKNSGNKHEKIKNPAKNASPAKTENEIKEASHKPAVIAIVRVRGITGIHPKRKYTIEMLNLIRSNQATIIHTSPSYNGMLLECKDYVTWGNISKDMLVKLLSKRGQIGKKKLSELKKEDEIEKIASQLFSGKSPKEVGINRNFRLHPPRKGWKNRKKRYPMGDLGPRESIDELLKRMI
ncbi:MAG: uL30 family ribosomal protein [Candidatus Micrarchaeota archaeon]